MKIQGGSAHFDFAQCRLSRSPAKGAPPRVGFSKEHFLHLYFRRAKTGELMFGTADSHRQRIAAAILDS